MKKTGFTIIELLVVGAMGAIVLMTVTYILINSTKMANRSRLNKAVEENGAWVSFEIKKNLKWAESDSLVCPIGVGSSIGWQNKFDGQPTVIKCFENDRIASESANGVELTGDEVWVTDCNQFVSCSYGADDPLPVVNFSYRILSGENTGNVDEIASKEFETSVTLRE